MGQDTFEQALRLIEAQDSRGAEIMRTIASRGDPNALFVLAQLSLTGTMVPPDPARGRMLLEYAASLGHSQANIIATNLLASGVAGKRNWKAALERLAAEARVLPQRRAASELVGAMELQPNGDPARRPEPHALSEKPRGVLFEGLLTAAECTYVISVAQDLFEPSMVYDASRKLVRDVIRTSDGAAIDWLNEDPAIHALNRRIAAVSGTSYEQGEALQVLRYSPGQQYRPHFDWVDGATNQRLWTALIYLNEEYEGGATTFVRTGLEVRGRTGDMLLFSNALESGDGDPLAEHAGLPVTNGTKFLATRWIREQRWIP